MLNKGINYATTIRYVAYLDIRAPVEEVACKILKSQADELRWKVRQVPEKASPFKLNITKKEKLVIKTLQSDTIFIS